MVAWTYSTEYVFDILFSLLGAAPLFLEVDDIDEPDAEVVRDESAVPCDVLMELFRIGAGLVRV